MLICIKITGCCFFRKLSFSEWWSRSIHSALLNSLPEHYGIRMASLQNTKYQKTTVNPGPMYPEYFCKLTDGKFWLSRGSVTPVLWICLPTSRSICLNGINLMVLWTSCKRTLVVTTCSSRITGLEACGLLSRYDFPVDLCQGPSILWCNWSS